MLIETYLKSEMNGIYNKHIIMRDKHIINKHIINM